MNFRKSLVTSYISENPSLISDPAKLARLILSETNSNYSLKELVKEIKETTTQLLSSDDEDSRKRVILSGKTIRTKVDNEFDGNASAAARAMGIPERTVRRWYSEAKNNNINTFVVTYGQNDTPVHIGFFNSIQHFLKENVAELVVYKGKYRNPTSIIESDKEGVSWDSRIKPYLLETHRKLNDRLVIYPAHTSPTAVRPLSGFDTHTGSSSGIFPHPKFQFKTVPTPSSSLPKILSTTGAITVPNYSQSKAGEKGKHHHIIGAVVVEIVDDKKFHLRQISAEKDGSFFDIADGEIKKYSADGITKKGLDDDNVVRKYRLETLVGGDFHFPFVDKNALAATKKQIIDFQPKHLFGHDVLDCWSINHHERGNRFLNTAKQEHGLINIENEVDGAVDFIAELTKLMNGGQVHIVPSNHDDALDRWLHDEQIDNLGINAAYFHYLSYKKHKSAKVVPTGFSFVDAFQFSAQEKLKYGYGKDITDFVSFLKRDVPLIIKGVDHSMHGDVGASGARGSALGLSKIGVKSTIGHSHSPQVIDGCYQMGVNSLIPLGYAKGASGWLHTNCFQYPSGKRTLITSIDGEFYLKKS